MILSNINILKQRKNVHKQRKILIFLESRFEIRIKYSEVNET